MPFNKKQIIIGSAVAVAVLAVGGVATATLLSTPAAITEVSPPKQPSPTASPSGSASTAPSNKTPSPAPSASAPGRDGGINIDDFLRGGGDGGNGSNPNRQSPREYVPVADVPVVQPTQPPVVPAPEPGGNGNGNGNHSGNGSNPTNPGGPTDPTDPGTNPGGPTDPTDPTDPTTPTTTIDAANAAYTAAYGVNVAETPGYKCIQFGSDTSTPPSVLPKHTKDGVDPALVGWKMSLDSKSTQWIVSWFVCDPIAPTTIEDANAAYTAAYGANPYVAGDAEAVTLGAQVSTPPSVLPKVTADGLDPANVGWKLSLSDDGKKWVVEWFNTKPTNLAAANAAYTAAYGTNPYNADDPQAQSISYSTTTPPDVKEKPVVDGVNPADIGWKLTVNYAHSAWTVEWFNTKPVAPVDPATVANPNSAANIGKFITAYNQHRVSAGLDALPVSRFQVPAATESLCWNAKNTRLTTYVMNHISEENPADPDPHVGNCADSEAAYQGWGKNQPQGNAYIADGKTAADGWWGSSSHKKVLYTDQRTNNPGACITFSSGYLQDVLKDGRINWAFSSVATWDACGKQTTIPALTADPALSGYALPSVTH